MISGYVPLLNTKLLLECCYYKILAFAIFAIQILKELPKKSRAFSAKPACTVN